MLTAAKASRHGKCSSMACELELANERYLCSCSAGCCVDCFNRAAQGRAKALKMDGSGAKLPSIPRPNVPRPDVPRTDVADHGQQLVRGWAQVGIPVFLALYVGHITQKIAKHAVHLPDTKNVVATGSTTWVLTQIARRRLESDVTVAAIPPSAPGVVQNVGHLKLWACRASDVHA